MNNLVILQKPAHLRHRTASLVLCIVIINCMLSALTGCNSKKLALSSPISVTDYKLNTYVQIDSYTNVNKNVLSDALGLCDYYEHIFSRTLETSELYKVNTQQTTAISDELYELIELGLYYSQLSYGAFDITIGSISSLWDFKNNTIPQDNLIKERLQDVSYKNIVLEKNHLRFLNEQTMIDLGAIAKGYIADQIKDYLLKKNDSSALINIGGNNLCLAQKQKQPYLISVTNTKETKDSILSLNINDLSVVTSGTYQRYIETDSKKYHHILDPSTGYSYENGLSAVTIISKSSIQGDALSTVCFSLGKEKGMKLLNSLKDVSGCFIDENNQITYSKHFKKFLAN